jgi:hypothetical protein
MGDMKRIEAAWNNSKNALVHASMTHIGQVKQGKRFADLPVRHNNKRMRATTVSHSRLVVILEGLAEKTHD